MKISKTKFIEYLRCPRYSALDEIEREQDNAVVSIDEFEDYDNERKKMLVKEFFGQFENMENDLGSLEIMLKYFNDIEVLTGKYMENLFDAPVVNSLITQEQKRFECEHGDFRLYSYTDVYQELGNSFNVCEVKAKTTNAIWKMAKSASKPDAKDRSIFEVCEDNIIRLREETGYNFDTGEISEKDYLKIRSKLSDHTHDVGRLILDLSFQRYIIENSTKNYDGKYFLGILNSEYVFHGEYENGFPNYTKDAEGREIICLVDFTKVTEEMQDKVKMLVEKVIDYLEKGDASKYKLGKYCERNKQRECRYYSICSADVPKVNSIFAYLHSHHGFKDLTGEKLTEYDLVNEGKVHMLDIGSDLLTRETNIKQREIVENKGEYIDKARIRTALNMLQYPLYHLDFESLPLPLPKHKGEKCYQQSLFQFSIHVEKSPGVCDFDSNHYEFLAKDHSDNRRSLAEKMLQVIKDDGGSIIVFNKSFEQGRIKELAALFPDIGSKLLALNDRIYDLLDVLKGSKSFYESLGYDASIFAYYHYLQSGSYSIKKVLPVFTDLTYEGMEVGNGMEALMVFEKYPTYNEVELKNKQKALVDYCKQDTWAMVEILDGLRKKISS